MGERKESKRIFSRPVLIERRARSLSGEAQTGSSASGSLFSLIHRSLLLPKGYIFQIERLQRLFLPSQAEMTSILAQAAHNVAASFLGNTHIKPGATIPAADVKEDSPDKVTPLTLTGKNILVSPASYF